jgi:inosose dehydratase
MDYSWPINNLRKFIKTKKKEDFMKLGYMTNGFGPLVGDGGGVTSVKDIRYLTLCDDEAVLKQITDVGFRYIEVLEGNLTKYAADIQVLKDMLAKYNAGMMSVCVGANFIYKDALEDEMHHMKAVATLAEQVGVSYVAFCGGAIRGKGIQEGDYQLLAEGLAEASKVFTDCGIEASYHPHLGSMAEHPEQIDRLFEKTDLKICPDLAHLAAGGGDPLTIVKKYYDRLSFVHLKDLDQNGFAPLGTGSIDLQGVLAFLKEQGYTGDYLVEVDGFAGDPAEACRVSYEYLKGKLI